MLISHRFNLFFRNCLLVSSLIFSIIITPKIANSSDWVYETGDLRGVWGTTTRDIFAVGRRGMILHYNGTRWLPMEVGEGDCTISYKFKDVWGSSLTDVYAVGCVDAAGDDQFDWCSGDDGVIFHYDGVSWEQSYDLGVASLYGVWGRSASDIFAVGNGGTILHYDGSSWTAMESGSTETLTAVWGTASGNVYAVGSGGTILHYDGGGWNQQASGTAAKLNGVWGNSDTNVYAVGEGGVILRYQGVGWTPIPAPGSGTVETLRDIWGTASTNIYAIGSGGTVLHFDGYTWSTLTSNTTNDLHGIWGYSGSNIFAVGDGSLIIRYNGSTWSAQSQASSEDLKAVWGTSENNVFAVGNNGTIIRYSGSGWRMMNSGTTEDLLGVWGSSVSSIYAVGNGGTILHYNGSAWSTVYSDPAVIFYDVWGSSGADVYVVGFLDTGGPPPSRKGLIRHYEGGAWSSMEFDEFWTLDGVWGIGENDVFVVGNGEDNRNILHFDGASWSVMDAGMDAGLYEVWGSSGNRVLSVGAGCPGLVCSFRISEYNGSAWSSGVWDLDIDADGTRLHSVGGRSADEVYAVGSVEAGGYAGQIILRNGGTTWWLDRYSLIEPSLYGIWASAGGHIFAVGAGGAILRLFPESTAPGTGETWARTFAGDGRDEASAVEATADGGSIVVGQTDSSGAGGTDVWVARLDASGEVQWQKTLGGPLDDRAASVKKTFDGGYIIAGSTDSFGAGASDAWIVKLDATGNVVWQNAYGGSDEDSALEVLLLGSAGCGEGYAVLGTTQTGSDEQDHWVLRLNKDGGVVWRKTFPLVGMESMVSLARGKGYGYFISGNTARGDAGYGDFLVLRLDDEGEVQWGKTFGLRTFVPPDHYNINWEDEVRVCVAHDGGPLLVGRSHPTPGYPFVWAVKLNALGEIEWQRAYEPNGKDVVVSSVQQTSDLGYIVGGGIGVKRASEPISLFDGWLMKLNKQGDIEWQKVYGGLERRDQDYIASVLQTVGGGYMAAGWTRDFLSSEGDSWVLRMDASGLIEDCSGVSNWCGGWYETMMSGVDIAVEAVDTATALNSTGAAVDDPGLLGEDACLSLSGDLIDLPQTGQTECYDAAGNVISCAGTGQDADILAGWAWPSPRFIDNGDGTMLDMLTGLVWMKDANYAQTVGYDSDGLMTWTESLDFVAVLNTGLAFSNLGYNDWRAANINELESLSHAGTSSPVSWLTGQGFEHVQTEYWSSTTHVGPTSTNYAWYDDLTRAMLTIRQKRGSVAVWPVRGGQMFHPDPYFPVNIWKTGLTVSYYPGDDGDIQAGVAWPNPRFTDHGDGTVTDKLTGLMWLKDTNCFGGMNWTNALATVADFNTDNRSSYDCLEYTAEYTDWRLPNRIEMISLFDRQKRLVAGNTALPTGHPFQVLPDGSDASYEHWTSTTVLTGYTPTDEAWMINLYGAMRAHPKGYWNRVWPVRGGTKCYGDCDGDGDVDGTDLVGFSQDFLADDPEGVCLADFNEDGHVDGQDFARFSGTYGRANCAVTISE